MMAIIDESIEALLELLMVENHKMLNENDIEQLTLQRLQSLGWEYRYGKDLPVHEGEFARGDLSGVVFIEQLRAAVRKLNPQLPESAVDSVVKSATKSDIGDLVVRNQAFYKLLRDGMRENIRLTVSRKSRWRAWWISSIGKTTALLPSISWKSAAVRGNDSRYIGFVNGLPLVVF